MVPAIKVKPDRMREAARKGFSTATDLADYLVRKGVPFRDAHEIVGRAVNRGIDLDKDLSQMSLKELQKFSKNIEQDVFDVLTLEGSVAARDHIGGTAPRQVASALSQAKHWLGMT
jgi:argininosuccinate lyase